MSIHTPTHRESTNHALEGGVVGAQMAHSRSRMGNVLLNGVDMTGHLAGFAAELTGKTIGYGVKGTYRALKGLFRGLSS